MQRSAVQQSTHRFITPFRHHGEGEGCKMCIKPRIGLVCRDRAPKLRCRSGCSYNCVNVVDTMAVSATERRMLGMQSETNSRADDVATPVAAASAVVAAVAASALAVAASVPHSCCCCCSPPRLLRLLVLLSLLLPLILQCNCCCPPSLPLLL